MLLSKKPKRWIRTSRKLGGSVFMICSSACVNDYLQSCWGSGDVSTFALFKYKWCVADTKLLLLSIKSRLTRPVDRHVQLFTPELFDNSEIEIFAHFLITMFWGILISLHTCKRTEMTFFVHQSRFNIFANPPHSISRKTAHRFWIVLIDGLDSSQYSLRWGQSSVKLLPSLRFR